MNNETIPKWKLKHMKEKREKLLASMQTLAETIIKTRVEVPSSTKTAEV